MSFPVKDACDPRRYRFHPKQLHAMVKEAGGLNQVCLAYEAANEGEVLPRSTLDSWVRGQYDPPISRLCKLTFTLGIDLRSLLHEHPLKETS